MKVFAGDNYNPAADASYKNLVWENLPVPDIVFPKDTPTIVSHQKIQYSSENKLKFIQRMSNLIFR